MSNIYETPKTDLRTGGMRLMLSGSINDPLSSPSSFTSHFN